MMVCEAASRGSFSGRRVGGSMSHLGLKGWWTCRACARELGLRVDPREPGLHEIVREDDCIHCLHACMESSERKKRWGRMRAKRDGAHYPTN
jgi:hypothetical protein